MKMHRTILKLFVVNIVATMLANSATADCFTQSRSEGGAELYVVSAGARVRVERTEGGWDIGIKLQEIGEDFVRIVVADGQAVELVGQVIGVDQQKRNSPQDTARVFVAAGQLVIIGKGQVKMRDLNGQGASRVECRAARGDEGEVFRSVLSGLGIKVRSKTVRVASGEAFLGAIGL